MFDNRKLRAAMILAGKSVVDISKALDVAPSTFYRKVEKGGDFTREEIVIIIRELKLDDPTDIFFADEIANTQNEKEA